MVGVISNTLLASTSSIDHPVWPSPWLNHLLFVDSWMPHWLCFARWITLALSIVLSALIARDALAFALGTEQQ